MKFVLAIPYNCWKLYIGAVFAVTLILFYPLLLILLSSERLIIYTFQVNVLWSRLVRILCFYALEIEGEVSEKKEPFIICANHTSYLDIFFMYSIYPRHRFIFMGKSEILAYPLVKTFFKRLNIPVDRSDRLKAARSFIQARNAMQKGWSIVIFPEGGIPDETPFLIPFKNGTFQLAKAANVAIQPMTFTNNYYLFSDPETVFNPAMPGLAKIVIHMRIEAEEIIEEDLKTLNNRVYDQINSCLPQKNA